MVACQQKSPILNLRLLCMGNHLRCQLLGDATLVMLTRYAHKLFPVRTSLGKQLPTLCNMASEHPSMLGLALHLRFYPCLWRRNMLLRSLPSITVLLICLFNGRGRNLCLILGSLSSFARDTLSSAFPAASSSSFP